MAVWSKPSPHVMKVNCNGMFARSIMQASVGCVMRNHQGHWIRGAAGMIGLALPMAAELWSIFYGLKLAWEKGDVSSVVIESDCKAAVDEVNNPNPDFHLADLVDLIQGLKNEAWRSCVIQHAPASSNAAAITLAEHELNGNGGVTELETAPGFMASVLEDEQA